MVAARDYWVATVHPDGRPHLTPVWGLWVDGAFYFGSGPQTRKARNLAENPSVAVHTVGEDEGGCRDRLRLGERCSSK